MRDMHDPYEDQLAAARYRAERDQARQECDRLRARLRDSVPREAYERKRAAWLRQIRECETALGKRRECIKRLESAALERRAVREEDREAAEWVRGHGGIEELRRMFQDADSRRVELCGALGIDLDKGWSEAMASMRLRLMPEGMSWPVFEDGEPVRIGDVVSDVEVRSVVFLDGGILLSDCTSVPGWGTWRSYKEPIKRPAPEVLDADGVEIRVGRDVWWICEGDERGLHAERLRVETILPDGLVECSPYNGGTWVSLDPSELYVNKPVLAADGGPLREGETMWDGKGNGPYIIKKIEDDGIVRIDSNDLDYFASEFFSERPDSWERLEEDARSIARDIAWNLGNWSPSDFEDVGDDVQARVVDLVRRAKKLAGVSECGGLEPVGDHVRYCPDCGARIAEEVAQDDD